MPDIVAPVSREKESKLHSQWDTAHGKGWKRRPAGHGNDWVLDEMLDRAREILHARESQRALSGVKDD